MTIDSHDTTLARHGREFDGQVVEDRCGVVHPGAPVRRIDRVEGAPEREVARAIIANVEDNDIAGVANADRLACRLAEEDDHTVGAKARLQAKTDFLEPRPAAASRRRGCAGCDASEGHEAMVSPSLAWSGARSFSSRIAAKTRSAEQENSAMSGQAIHCQPSQQPGSCGHATPTSPLRSVFRDRGWAHSDARSRAGATGSRGDARSHPPAGAFRHPDPRRSGPRW